MKDLSEIHVAGYSMYMVMTKLKMSKYEFSLPQLMPLDMIMQFEEKRVGKKFQGSSYLDK